MRCVLICLFELKNKSGLDLTESKTNLAEWFDHKHCLRLSQLDYIANLICKFNKLNLQYQSFGKNIYKAHTIYNLSEITSFSHPLNLIYNFRI